MNAFTLRRHLCKVHPEIHLIPKDGDHSSQESESRLLPCRVCFRTFPSSEELESHVGNDHGKQKCPTCGLQFKQKGELRRHEVTIHVEGDKNGKERPVKCDHCQSYFKTKKRLSVSILQ